MQHSYYNSLHKSQFGSASLQLTPQEETDLRDIATAYSPSAHHAQTMLLIARGEEYPAVLPDFPAFLDTALLQQLLIENINFKTALPASGKSAAPLASQKTSLLTLAPNPASNDVFVSYRGVEKENLQVILLSITGKEQLRQSMIYGNANLNTANLPNGLYICIVQNAVGSIVAQEKLSIVR